MPAKTQKEHEEINSHEYPGTRQLCVKCGEPTERCEEDSIYINDVGPLCLSCSDILMHPTDSQELKPCPFCGSTPIINRKPLSGSPFRIFIQCVYIHCTIMPQTIRCAKEKEALRLWNTRKEPTQ
jgi:hypothetical protein